MKRKVLIPGLFILLGIAVLGIIGLNLTGYVSWAPDFQGISRAVPIKNSTTNTTDVHLRIASTENVLAIQEFFSSPNCSVLSYSLDKDIDIFEFNENENTWIFANSSDFLDVELFYQIPYECDVSSGKYYTVDGYSKNLSFSINSSAESNIAINSPKNGWYPKNQILMNISTKRVVSTLEYIDYSDLKPKFKLLCRNCKNYFKKLTFSEGIHDLTVKSTDALGNISQESLNFAIDSKLPRITSVEPKSGKITNGSLIYIMYSESNLKSVMVYYGNNQSKELTNCTSGNNRKCSTNIDLSGYDSQYISYWFVVSDYLRNVSSKVNRIKVDTSIPVLNVISPKIALDSTSIPVLSASLPKIALYSTKVQFKIDVSEKVNLEYYPKSALKPKWTRLCFDCDKYDNLISFSVGTHEIIIRAIDQAGNSFEAERKFRVL